MTTPEVSAGIYCRISRADIEDKTKVTDQQRICRKLAESLGWHVAEVYEDNNKSAWKHNRKRPGWDKMLADVEAGKITAIIVYHGDRLVRQPRDLEDLIDLSRTRGIRLASPTGVRNLSSDEDQFILTIEAAMARRESANTSRRKKAQYERLRLKGLTRPGGGGGRAFGFESDGVTHRPDEAQAIRDAAAAVIAGASLGSAVRQLADAGFLSTAGNIMGQSAFRRILLSPRTAGLMPDGASTAAWPAILDRADWETLRALLLANEVKGQRGAGALHLLSGIATCGRCQHVLWAARGARSYKCPDCSLSRSLEMLDAYVTRRVVNRLAASPAGRIPAAPGLAAEFAALTEARTEIEEAIADHTRGKLPALLARLDSIDARLAQLRELAGDDARARLLASHSGITPDSFAELPLSVRRSLVRACFDVEVLPVAKRGPLFSTEDVRLTAR